MPCCAAQMGRKPPFFSQLEWGKGFEPLDFGFSQIFFKLTKPSKGHAFERIHSKGFPGDTFYAVRHGLLPAKVWQVEWVAVFQCNRRVLKCKDRTNHEKKSHIVINHNESHIIISNHTSSLYQSQIISNHQRSSSHHNSS